MKKILKISAVFLLALLSVYNFTLSEKKGNPSTTVRLTTKMAFADDPSQYQDKDEETAQVNHTSVVDNVYCQESYTLHTVNCTGSGHISCSQEQWTTDYSLLCVPWLGE